MSDLMTKEYYDSVLSSDLTKIDKVSKSLIDIVLLTFKHPVKGQAWIERKAKIHNKYEQLYNLSVDAIEGNIEEVDEKQLASLHRYCVRRFNLETFQFTTEVEQYAADRIYDIELKRKALLATNKIDPKTVKLIESAKADLQKMYADSEAKMLRLLSLSKQSGLSVVTTEELFATGISAGDKSFLQATFKQLTAGQLIEVIGKDKVARHFKPSYIVNSIARDTFHTQQALNTRKIVDEYGFDLIRISSHNTRTELCQYYEGGLYAKDAQASKKTGFPVLDMDTPFHYGCLHNMLPEDYGFVKMTGDLKQSQDFSKQLAKANKEKDISLITKKPVYPSSYTKPATRPTMPLKTELDLKKEKLSLSSKKLKGDALSNAEKRITTIDKRLKAGGVKGA